MATTRRRSRGQSLSSQLGLAERQAQVIPTLQRELADRWELTLAADGSTVTAHGGRQVVIDLRMVEQTEECSDLGTGRLVLAYGPAGARVGRPEPRGGYQLDLLADELADYVKAQLARNTGNPERDARVAICQDAARDINAALGLSATSAAHAYASDSGYLRVQITAPVSPEHARLLLQLCVDLGIVRQVGRQ